MVEGYLEKVYAGLIGMAAGVRLGAPVEPDSWTKERIRRVFGEIKGYVKEFKNFAADDDTNGPFFLIRALLDMEQGKEMTCDDAARVWRNYAREEVGLFWWGGYGVSTSHTAYLNLSRGISAPRSGSAEQNGIILAEQVGGQLFIDTFGMVFPDNIQKAAEYARTAASVSHDGNALEGAAFVAACVSKAFTEREPEKIIKAGLSVIAPQSTYAAVINRVLDFYKECPGDWEACFKYLEKNWGYDKYPGACHVIPNAGVCAMSLLYGGGDFNRSIEIATTCGWDTDSDAGTVGSIMGVAAGLEGIGERYRKPINDVLVMSGISGSLNIVDVPAYAMTVAQVGYRRAGEAVPEDICGESKDLNFDFELPGSTHGFRVSDGYYCSVKHSFEEAHRGSGALEIFFDRLARGRKCKVYHKTFYRREDFSDERYMPVFSPKAYPGQKVRFYIKADRWSGEGLFIQPYVRDTFTKKEVLIGGRFVREPGWVEIAFTIPDMEGSVPDEIGFILEGDTPSTKGADTGRLFLDDFTVSGNAEYYIDLKKQSREFASITPFSHNRGAWSLENGRLHAMCQIHCEAMTGNYFTRDMLAEAQVTPAAGESHLISVRVAGAAAGYYAGFNAYGKAAILINDGGLESLAETDFPWEINTTYNVSLRAEGANLVLKIDGKEVLSVEDTRLKHGMVGYAKYAMGRTFFGNLRVKEL